jgi:MFS family permease
MPDVDQPKPESPEAILQHDPYAALREPNFRWFLAGNVLSMLGLQMQTYAVGWEIYTRTRSNAALAWVGLVQVIPVILLFLPAGQLIDRLDRRRVLTAALSLAAFSAVGLAITSATQGNLLWSYVFLFGVGTARAFLQPARAALLPQILPKERFSSAVTWNSGGFQLAMVTGPLIGGLVVGWTLDATPVYVFNAFLAIAYMVCLAMLKLRPAPAPIEAPSFRSLAAGIGFVWNTRVILAALTLDMFAVLLGGATALLPVYAMDVLYVSPFKLSWMRAAPGIGALLMSAILTHRPPLARAGRALLWAVAGFGAATIVFGLSRSFTLSLAMLFLMGMLDMVSVVVRQTLVQLLTPDEMRGRVSSINSLFIGISNELGEAESGSVAALFSDPNDHSIGPTISVVTGGIGTILVVAIAALRWPELRRYGRLDGVPQNS